MDYKNYEQFVINYQPFEWEIDHSDLRETMKAKHSFLSEFVYSVMGSQATKVGALAYLKIISKLISGILLRKYAES